MSENKTGHSLPPHVGQVINTLAELCHESSRDAGWWKPPEVGVDDWENKYHLGTLNTVDYLELVIPTKLALIHSEISEAMEGFRKSMADDHLPDRPMAEVELADALIRIFDLAGACQFDLGGALLEKFAYNQDRADHKAEAREADGGKKF